MERKLQQIKEASISRKAVQPPKREILGWKTGTMNSEALRTYCYNGCRFIRKLKKNCKTLATESPEGGDGLRRALEQQSDFPYSTADFPSSCRGFCLVQYFLMNAGSFTRGLLTKVVYTGWWLQKSSLSTSRAVVLQTSFAEPGGTRSSQASQNSSALQGTIHKYWGAGSGEVFPHSSSAREVTPDTSGMFLGVGRGCIILTAYTSCSQHTSRFCRKAHLYHKSCTSPIN